MKLGYSTALIVALGWFLMRPPLPHLDTSAVHSDPSRPLARWVAVKSFPIQERCEAARNGNRWQLCVASDDPRLKK
jgi:hypothetical protein